MVADHQGVRNQGGMIEKPGTLVDEDQCQCLQGRGIVPAEIGSYQQGALLMKRAICLATFLALSAVGPGHAQVGNPQEGSAWAQQVCSVCHAVGRGQVRSPNARSPAFSELATTPGMTSVALMVALTTPHAGMPMFVLTADQREDIIAYILSLR
jgi:mono/diheme cytochrome c family protein